MLVVNFRASQGILGFGYVVYVFGFITGMVVVYYYLAGSIRAFCVSVFGKNSSQTEECRKKVQGI